MHAFSSPIPLLSRSLSLGLFLVYPHVYPHCVIWLYEYSCSLHVLRFAVLDCAWLCLTTALNRITTPAFLAQLRRELHPLQNNFVPCQGHSVPLQ